MNVLCTGRGTSGSWQIRAVQLGRAIGATVQPQANNLKGFDLVILVKRPTADLLARIRQRGVPLIWDVVDSWSQPAGNSWTEAQAKDWLYREIEVIKPVAIVAATEQMAADIKGIPTLALPHHGRPGPMNPIREKVQRIGYEGSEKHLGRWSRDMAQECKRRGIEWVVNPSKLSDLDIVVALREETGYAPMNWKSGVKLANAQITGTPCILAKEAGYIETASGGEMWATDLQSVSQAIDYLEPRTKRLAASAMLKSKDVSLETTAKKYMAWLSRSKFF